MLNIYCDESCHLENDGSKSMVIGGIIVPNTYRKSIYDDIKKIKSDFNIPTHREIKWIKVSPKQLEYYKTLVNYFFDNEVMRFRGVVVPDKSVLRHTDFGQTHDEFYYKLYFLTLKKLLDTNERIQVFIDIKDTNGNQKVEKLQRYLNNHARDNTVTKIQQIRSHENSILQLADLIIGGICYANRGLDTSDAKLELAELINERTPRGIRQKSFYNEEKINLLFFDRS